MRDCEFNPLGPAICESCKSILCFLLMFVGGIELQGGLVIVEICLFLLEGVVGVTDVDSRDSITLLTWTVGTELDSCIVVLLVSSIVSMRGSRWVML